MGPSREGVGVRVAELRIDESPDALLAQDFDDPILSRNWAAHTLATGTNVTIAARAARPRAGMADVR